MAITYSDFDTLSKGRKKYIEKRASKAGLSVADYLKAQSDKAKTLIIDATKQHDKADKLGYIPNNIENYQPDAGINSKPEATNYYWFQTAEFAQDMLRKQGMGMGYKSYEHHNERVAEIGFSVDIMDEAGDKHVINHPKNGEGFALTMRFTAKQVDQLADAIDKGGMSVRLSGKPAELNTSLSREQFRIVDCEEIYSKGNHSGRMMFVLNVNGRMVNTTSKDVATSLRSVASMINEKANA